MIYETVKTAVERVKLLEDRCFPPGVCVDDVPPPFAVYAFGKQSAETDLGGAVHHYTDEVTVDLLAADYDTIHALYRETEAALVGLAHRDNGAGEYIFGVACDSPEPDSADLDIGLWRRTLRAAIQWCPLED